jgi:tRNA 2-thiouridine synthesizing protein B
MSTLHTVNKSPFDRPSLTSCLNHLMPGDAVLLIEDGVIAARKGSAFSGPLEAAMKDCSVYVLSPDSSARGIGDGDMVSGIETVDYGGFVGLVVKHDRTQSWL